MLQVYRSKRLSSAMLMVAVLTAAVLSGCKDFHSGCLSNMGFYGCGGAALVSIQIKPANSSIPAGSAQQLKAVGSERDAMLEPAREGPPTPASLLAQLKGIGPEFAAVLWSEGLFRSFNNRRQVAAYAGLAPTPWQSGSVAHEQGVSKAGNPRLRTTMIQLAWLWLRHQPGSALSIWFRERVQRNGGRGKKTAIVAMARKLLVALWKYAVHGILIDGTKAKAA